MNYPLTITIIIIKIIVVNFEPGGLAFSCFRFFVNFIIITNSKDFINFIAISTYFKDFIINFIINFIKSSTHHHLHYYYYCY